MLPGGQWQLANGCSPGIASPMIKVMPKTGRSTGITEVEDSHIEGDIYVQTGNTFDINYPAIIKSSNPSHCRYIGSQSDNGTLKNKVCHLKPRTKRPGMLTCDFFPFNPSFLLVTYSLLNNIW